MPSPKRLRFIPEDALVEVTIRTTASMLLMRPSPALNQAILGILGRALHFYGGGLALHAFVFMSNHWHALASVRHAAVLAAFLRHVNGNVARAVQRELDYPGRIWHRRPATIVVLDDDAAERRLQYILSHGVKERLVRAAADWPGVHCVDALLGKATLRGVWLDRRAALRGRFRPPVDDDGVRHPTRIPYDVPLALPPLLARPPLDQRQRRLHAILGRIHGAARGPCPRRRRHPRPGLLFSRPAHSSSSPCPSPPHRRPRTSAAPSAHATAAFAAAHAAATEYQRAAAAPSPPVAPPPRPARTRTRSTLSSSRCRGCPTAAASWPTRSGSARRSRPAW